MLATACAGVAGGALDSAALGSGLGLGYCELSVISYQGVIIPYLIHHADHKALLLNVVGANSLFILQNLALA